MVDYINDSETQYGKLIALVVQVSMAFDNFHLVSILWLKKTNNFEVRLDEKCANLKAKVLKEKKKIKGIMLNNESVTNWKSVEELKNVNLNLTIVR